MAGRGVGERRNAPMLITVAPPLTHNSLPVIYLDHVFMHACHHFRFEGKLSQVFQACFDPGGINFESLCWQDL